MTSTTTSDMQRHPLTLVGTELYRPLCAELQQFRLLTILPARTGKICALLHIASLNHESLPAYETVSYVWGNRDHRDYIVANGAILNVPNSSAMTLRHLRLPDRERTVWIDAVCINQSDIAERSAQVGMMAEIYMRGQRNVIFLGSDAGGDAESILALLIASSGRIYAAAEELSEDDRGKFVINGITPDAWHDNTILDGLDYSGYRKFYSLPWFRRLWVLQEAVLSAKNICYWGTTEFLLSTALWVALVLFNSTKRHLLGELNGVMAAKEMHHHYARRSSHWIGDFAKSEPFGITMGLLDGFEVTDPRDRVYATVLLWRVQCGRATLPRRLRPDYSKSIQQVNRDATRYVLESESVWQAAYLLSSIHHRTIEDLTDGQPTWAVSWGRSFNGRLDPLPIKGSSAGHRCPSSINEEADYDRRMRLRITANSDMLDAYVGLVGSISATWSVGADNIDAIQQLLATTSHMEMSASAMADLFTLGWTGPEHFAGGFHHSDEKLDCLRCFIEFVAKMQTLPPEWEADAADTDREKASRFYTAFRNLTEHRSLFSVCGRLGWGSKLTQQGDVVVVAEGAHHPYVLRPFGTSYRFLGCAYVSDLMHGEVFNMDAEWRWVNIY